MCSVQLLNKQLNEQNQDLASRLDAELRSSRKREEMHRMALETAKQEVRSSSRWVSTGTHR